LAEPPKCSDASMMRRVHVELLYLNRSCHCLGRNKNLPVHYFSPIIVILFIPHDSFLHHDCSDLVRGVWILLCTCTSICVALLCTWYINTGAVVCFSRCLLSVHCVPKCTGITVCRQSATKPLYQ